MRSVASIGLTFAWLSSWLGERLSGEPISPIVSLQEIKGMFQSEIIIVDLPPVLTSDDVLAVLPNLDCAVLVTAVGTATPAEIEEPAKHLPSTEVVRLGANKVQPYKSKYYY